MLDERTIDDRVAGCRLVPLGLDEGVQASHHAACPVSLYVRKPKVPHVETLIAENSFFFFPSLARSGEQ